MHVLFINQNVLGLTLKLAIFQNVKIVVLVINILPQEQHFDHFNFLTNISLLLIITFSNNFV